MSATEISIQHDGNIDIATGRSRKETNWKNKEMSWSALVEKLSSTHRTAETYTEYITAKKLRQDEIKDVGGFVGGALSGGRRKFDSVVHRQLLTLDIDFGEPGIWEDFAMLYDNAAVVYSTHKHSPQAPRLRLILPLDRPVFADEYVAIARRIAGDIGIDYFDHTTFEPSRLMYWPSTSKDGEFYFNYQDGPWLSADQMLGRYRDWRDSSEWPVSSRNHDIVLRAIKKQGDPLEKPGIVGAFCRTYGIAEAIDTFLSDVYETCDVEDRYTYKEGSTAAGLVVYDDKYAYSHHGTDPVSRKLCNAFDLVRLHLFGLKDEDSPVDTPSNRLPSFTEMVEFATKDPRVRKQIGSERLQDARGDFDEDLQEEDLNDDWIAELDVDRKGNYYSTINNIILVLKNDPRLKGRFAFNAFEQREIATKNLPWRKITPQTKYLTDRDDAGVRHYLENTYGMTGIQKVKDAMDIVLIDNTFHPVRDYIDSLKWDGVSRVDTLLIEYLGAEDNEYIRAVTRKTLTAAVARVYNPGVKYDYVTTLVGKQGIGKSTIIKKLGREWYSDSFGTVQGKEAYEQIQGVWLVEMGELAGLKKAELETVKHFISKQVDRYRVAYGRRIENFPRQCVFFGTTNHKDFLRDPTGDRRFWPVATEVSAPRKNVWNQLTGEEVNQIWAEAMTFYKAGETLFLSPELEEIAFATQAEHREQDERAGIIQKYLDTLLPDNWDDLDVYQRRAYLQGDELQPSGTKRRTRVCVAEIWCEVLGGMQRDMNRFNTKDLHNIMRSMDGWAEYDGKIRTKLYGLQRGFYRVSEELKNVTTGSKSVVTNKG